MFELCLKVPFILTEFLSEKEEKQQDVEKRFGNSEFIK